MGMGMQGMNGDGIGGIVVAREGEEKDVYFSDTGWAFKGNLSTGTKTGAEYFAVYVKHVGDKINFFIVVSKEVKKSTQKTSNDVHNKEITVTEIKQVCNQCNKVGVDTLVHPSLGEGFRDTLIVK